MRRDSDSSFLPTRLFAGSLPVQTYNKTQILNDHGHMVQQQSHDPDANRVKLHVLNYNDSNILLVLLLQRGSKVTQIDISATAD